MLQGQPAFSADVTSPSLLETFPVSASVCQTTQIEDTSASPGRVPGAVVTPTLWDPPSAAVSMEPTISDTPCTDSLDFAVPTDAQPSNAGGASHSPPERVQRALRLAQLHDESGLFHAREVTLLAWTHDMQTRTRPPPKSHLLDPLDLLPDDTARAP